MVIFIPLALILILYYTLVYNHEFQDNVWVLETISQIVSIMVCVDCLVCNVFWISTFLYCSRRYKLMKISNEEDSRIFMCECIFMNISAFCRFCIELIFYVIQPFIYKGKVDFCLRPF